MTNRPLIAATRKETSYTLQLIEGSVPDDWYGHVFITSPAGTVNSGGLPYPPDSQEQGSPIMNGDGYVFRFDLISGLINVQTELMKPPCYYADMATRNGNPNKYGPLYLFRNMGMSRLSFNLGARNELNTAVTPFKFKNEKYARLLACYDAGKAWEFDSQTLDMVTAIGYNSEYAWATPNFLFPFPVIQTTAHPCFDPITQELFTVNYTRQMVFNNEFEVVMSLLKEDLEAIEKFLVKIIKDIGSSLSHSQILEKIEELLGVHTKPHEQKALGWLKNMFVIHLGHNPGSAEKPVGDFDVSNNVYLMRMDGGQGALDKWEVLDENGNPLKIIQCMHQTCLTEDYIVLADATFKFSLDLMFNSLFKDRTLNNWLRSFLTVTQLPNLQLYIVNRQDLTKTSTSVKCKPLASLIPLEAVHFTADYKNPGGKITMHLAHNSAACLAEWVRDFDTLAPDGTLDVDNAVIGLISVGSMDIGRIGKVVIDAPSATIVSQDYLLETGNIDDIDNIGPHTWGVGLNTYRGITDADKLPDEIRHNYWSSYGLDTRLLTKFIYELYYNYSHRYISQAQMLSLTETGIPFVLSRQNTATMKLEDFYQFGSNVILKSVQFVPRLPDAKPVTDDEQKDGYILTTVLVNYVNDNGNNYQCEVWIFNAWDLASGPCCRLNHPDLDYAFTLHSAWIEGLGRNTANPYYVDPKLDYNPIISRLEPSIRQGGIQELFDTFVYPNFPPPINY